MAKKEVKTDYWVNSLLKEADLNLEPQGSSIKEISEALNTASKSRTGKIGFPDFVGVVKDFIIVIEDKADLNKHVKYTDDGAISTETSDIINYALNGALHYAKHLIKNTNYEKVIAIGVSGNEKRHRITPIFVDYTEPSKPLDDVESFISFNDKNILEYYNRMILKEDTTEKDLQTILKDAEDLHNDLRIYGSLGTREKPIVVSGILLALDEIENGNFSIERLTGNEAETDGEKIYNAINSKFKTNPIKPERKRDKILAQFNVIKNSEILNKINSDLNKTPLRYFAEYLYEHIYKSIKYTSSSEDYLGRFYSEFMSYGGGDGQNLGIILTPKHITDLFCDLAELKSDDIVLDPCCGSGGFLVSAMHHMLKLTEDEEKRNHIKQEQLQGIEIEDYMFSIAVTNMILRGDGKSNIESADFFDYKAGELKQKSATVGMINPPYSLAKKKKNAKLYEICFIEHLLNCLTKGAKCIAIVPQSSFTGKTKEEQIVKENILKHHTLEGVITLNKDTFYGVGVMPCIAVFTAGIPHSKNHLCKFINFEDDGFKVAPHIGLIETESAKDKKQHLLDVWFNRIDSETKFCVKTTIEAKDEWLHSFYYFNDEIPTEADFEKTVGDYLSFEFSMIMQGREYLFEDTEPLENKLMEKKTLKLSDRNWKEFFIKDICFISSGRDIYDSERIEGNIPYITSASSNNGIKYFVSNFNDTIEENAISVNRNGSVGYSFYHKYKALYSNDCRKLKLRNFDNEFVALFITNQIMKQKEKYNYGYKMGTARLKRQYILLPVNEQDEPDYEYMEEYTKNIIFSKYDKYVYYLENLILNLDYKEIPKLEDKEWKEFKIVDLFEISFSAGDNQAEKLEEGLVPLLSSGYSEINAICKFIKNGDNKSKIILGNVLTIDMFGAVKYHPYSFYAVSHGRIIILKPTFQMNEKIGLFIVQALSQAVKMKFSYAQMCTSKRMLRQTLQFPINDQGEPDYEYMEQYAKNIMFTKYNQYLDYLKKLKK